MPVLLHGDAAFAGQGIVAEVFNLAQLRGYRTGGTLHLVINNQIGFTTNPASGRSSVYSTDVAKINQVPIFHVNGDDPEAAYRVLQIALDYRQEFHKDVVVDLIGFRLHGHNEGDEPTYTQPIMYRRIQAHPGVKTIYARRLVRDAVLTEDEVKKLEEGQVASYEAALIAAQEAAKRPAPAPATVNGRRRRKRASGAGRAGQEAETGVAREILGRIGHALTTVPAGFNLNPKMVQQLARRAKMAEGVLRARLGDGREPRVRLHPPREIRGFEFPGRIRRAEPFPNATSSSMTRRPARTGFRSARSPRIRRRSSSTTVPCRKWEFSGSSTATAWSGRMRS